MEDNKTSIFERLKICWYVLTKRYYLYFGLDKDLIVWNENDTYKCLKESSFKYYQYISKDYEFLAHDKKTNLHDFVLKVIVKFINNKLIREMLRENLPEPVTKTKRALENSKFSSKVNEDLDFQTFAKEMVSVFSLPSSETKNTEEEPLNWEYAIAKHFYKLGLKAQKL